MHFTDCAVHKKGGHILLRNEQYFEAQTVYEFAYGLVLGVRDSTPLDAMLALEQLAQVSMLRDDVAASGHFLDRILRILQRSAPSTTTVDIEAEEEEEEMDHRIHALNVKALYSCLLSLHSFEHRRGHSHRMKEAMDLAADCLGALRQKLGPRHPAALGMTLYFGLHFVSIEEMDCALDHIEYVVAHSHCAGHQPASSSKTRRLQFAERRTLQDLLCSFTAKLLELGQHEHSMKGRSLKVLRYQMESAEELNRDIAAERARRQKARRERAKEKEAESASPRRSIKKEKEEESEDGAHRKPEEPVAVTTATTDTTAQSESESDRAVQIQTEGEDADLRPIDVVQMVLDQQIPLMLQFGAFEAAKVAMDDLENNPQRTLTERHRVAIESLRAECATMKEGANRHRDAAAAADSNVVHSPSTDRGLSFHGIPEFMPTATTSSDSINGGACLSMKR